jgi:RimJ/RimL family protein N-acetyltransferase
VASPADFEKLLWHETAFSCVASQLGSQNELIGLVELFGVDEANGHAQISVAAFEAYRASGLIIEAAALFLDEVFWRFNLRKVYAMLSDSSMAEIGSMLDGFFKLEGRLSDHVFLNGRLESVHITSIGRDAFAALTTSKLPLVRCSSGPWRLAQQSATP